MIDTYYNDSPSAALRPDGADELAKLIRQANDEGRSFEIIGGGSKRSFGDKVYSERQIYTSNLTGIELYEPDELVIKVAAGTPLATVNTVLGEHNQFLPFEPPEFSGLFGAQAGQSTIGGVICCNLSGSRRVLSGSARDSVLGIEAINGRGERFNAGGRTIKNVTGFDISRLVAGSFGTLAVLTSVTLKVLPTPQREMTLLVSDLSDHGAIECMSVLLRLPYEISGAAHLGGARAGTRTTALRIDGFSGSVSGRADELFKRLRAHGLVEKLEGEESQRFWTSIRDLSDFSSDPQSCIWRLAMPCEQAVSIVELLDGPAIYEWGGGRVFVRTSVEKARSQAHMLRRRIAAIGGNASLLRAPLDVRSELGTFQAQTAHVNRLTERVREAFDPNQVLNAGKLASLGARI